MGYTGALPFERPSVVLQPRAQAVVVGGRQGFTGELLGRHEAERADHGAATEDGVLYGISDAAEAGEGDGPV